MANVLSALQIQQIVFAYVEAMAGYQSQFAKVCPVRDYGQGEVRVSRGAFGGIASTLSAGATSSTVSNIATFESTFNTAHRYVRHQLPSFKLKDDKGLIAIGQALAAVAMKNIDREIGSGLEGLLAANAPRVGTGVGQVGSGKKFFDTAKKGLQSESGEFTWANLVASTLSESSLDAALQLMIKWRDDRGLQMMLGRSNNLALVCAASNLSTAIKLTGSGVTDADLQKNWRNGMFGGGITPWEFDDSDVALLVDVDATPFAYNLVGVPNIEAGVFDPMLTTFLVEYDGCFLYSPYEYGAVALNAE